MSPSRAVDAACDRFEDRWRSGEEPDIAEHLDAVPPDEREALLHELVLLDAAWRRRRGEAVTVDYYAARFPELDVASAARELGAGPPSPGAPRFELLERLGAGSFGTTWKARDAALGRDVALKVSRSVEGEEAVRFVREARAAARLKHPGIAAVHEALEHEGRAALVTELVDGPSLHARLASGWRPSPREAATLVAHVAEALHHAHELGVVHRDVKPANIVVDTASGRPVLVDFGLARDEAAATLTQEGHVLGTPAYMSPEQALGDSKGADERSDVYSCGAVLYEMLTGRPPFPPGPGLIERVAHEEPVPPRRLMPALPRDLETIVLKAMAKARSARYPSGAELAEDLRRWLDGHAIHARPVSPLGRASRWARRQPLLAGSLVVVVALLVVLATVMVQGARDVARERDAAIEALARTRVAEGERNEQAFESRLAEATAWSSSLRSGRRFDALRALDAATALLPSLPPRADRKPRLRTALLSALCLTDMSPAFGHPVPPETQGVAFSRHLSAWARSDALGAISVLDAEGRQLVALPGSGRPTSRLEFSPDGERLIAVHEGGGPATLIAWDWRGVRVIARVEPAPPELAWKPDGHALHVAMGGDAVGLMTLDEDGIVPVPGVAGRLLAAGPAGRLLFTNRHDLRKLHVASALTGGVISRMEVPEDAWVGALDPVGGRRALVSSGSDLILFDVESGRRLATLKGHQSVVTTVAISPDGRWGASHGWDGVTRAWDLETGREQASSRNAPLGLAILAFAQDGSRLLAHSDGTRTGPFALALEAPLREISLVDLLGFAPGLAELSDDGKLLLAWAEPGRIGQPAALADLDAARRVAVLPDRGTVTATFMADGRSIVTSGLRGVRTWPITQGAGGWTVGDGRSILERPARDAAIAGERFAAVLDTTGEVVVGRLEDGRIECRFLPRRRPFTLGLDARAERVAIGSWHGRGGACHDARDGRLLFEMTARTSLGVAFSPVDGSLVAHAGDELRLLDPDTGALRSALLLGGGSDVPVRVAVARDARLAAVLDMREQGRLRLLDAATLEDIAGVQPAALESESLAWCTLDAAGSRLCAATASGRMFVWDLAVLRAELRARGLDW